MSKRKQENYDQFLKKFMEETGKDGQTVVELMKRLKRIEGKLHRMFEKDCNEGNTPERTEIETELQLHVIYLMKKFKTIKVRFNSDPRGGAIRFIFKKTGWINTLGSDVAIDW